jgi:D-3-phosphoglycerate dehydrogenase
MVLVELLNDQLEEPVNVVNAKLFADQRGIKVRSVVEEEAHQTPVLTIDLVSGEDQRHISGTVYTDGQPRILHINGYHMDIVPAGPMLILLNEDRPGMVGLVGTEFGDAGANIADLALSRRDDMAMMVLKLDAAPSESLVSRLLARPGIMKVAAVTLANLLEGVDD